MTLSDIQAAIYRRTGTDASSFPAADMLIEINAAYNKVNSKIRQYLDNYFPTQFSSGDLSTGTAQPVFDPLFHDLVALYVSYDRAVENNLAGANGFGALITILERDLLAWYGSKNWQVCAITIASPAIVTKKNHGLIVNDLVIFQTTGVFPTGVTATISSTQGVYYYVTQIIDPDTFYISATKNGTPINTSGSQSGQQYLSSDRMKAMRVAYHDTR